MYFEVLDSIITAIEDRFDQKSFQAYNRITTFENTRWTLRQKRN